MADSQLFKTMTQIKRPVKRVVDSRNTSASKVQNVHTSIAASSNVVVKTISEEPKQVIQNIIKNVTDRLTMRKRSRQQKSSNKSKQY